MDPTPSPPPSPPQSPSPKPAPSPDNTSTGGSGVAVWVWAVAGVCGGLAIVSGAHTPQTCPPFDARCRKDPPLTACGSASQGTAAALLLLTMALSRCPLSFPRSLLHRLCVHQAQEAALCRRGPLNPEAHAAPVAEWHADAQGRRLCSAARLWPRWRWRRRRHGAGVGHSNGGWQRRECWGCTVPCFDAPWFLAEHAR